MTHLPENPHKSSPRLSDYDYSRNGVCFVTTCTHNNQYLFGTVIDSVVQLNNPGRMLELWWTRIADRFPHLTLDVYQIMPNHFHGLIFINGDYASVNLSRAVGWFKSMTTTACIHGVRDEGWKPFTGKLWQRSFYDHIVRREESLNTIRQYILNNLARWQYLKNSDS